MWALDPEDTVWMETMGLYRTVSETDGAFSRKSHNFPTRLYFARRRSAWFPLELGIGDVGRKTRVICLPGRQRSMIYFSRLECTNATDRWTDEQTDTGRQQTPRLRIASRGKN